MVDAEFSESLDSTCPSKKGCQFVDAAGGSSHGVGLMVASTSRVSCSARSWAMFCHSGTSSVWLWPPRKCVEYSDSLIFLCVCPFNNSIARRSVFAGRISPGKVLIATLSSSDCHLRCSVLIGRFHFTELLVTELETSWVKDKLNHRWFWFGTGGSSLVIPPRVSDLLGKRRCRLRLGGSKTQIRQSEIRWSRVNLQLGVAQKPDMRTENCTTR